MNYNFQCYIFYSRLLRDSTEAIAIMR